MEYILATRQIQEGLYDRSLESDVIVKKSRMSFTPTSFEEAVTQFRKCFDKHRKYLAITLLNRFANLLGYNWKAPPFFDKALELLRARRSTKIHPFPLIRSFLPFHHILYLHQKPPKG
jgi:hypothetical protein